MTELPKAGDAWFNRKTLESVEIGKCGSDRVFFDGGPEESDLVGISSLKYFLRDYARDLPLTPQVLEGMGWTGDGIRNEFTFLFPNPKEWNAYWCLSIDLTNHECDVKYSSNEDSSSWSLAPVATLRDLLNVLRVFNVPAEVPEVSQ